MFQFLYSLYYHALIFKRVSNIGIKAIYNTNFISKKTESSKKKTLKKIFE